MKKVIYLEWYDAETNDDWTSLDDTKEDHHLPVIKTVGFLVKKTKDLFIVSCSIDEKNSMAAQTIKIPTRWVKSKKYLVIK
jgi:hypothetical protein